MQSPKSVFRDEETGVWMTTRWLDKSFAREVAESAMSALRLDPEDFRKRDKVVAAIADRVNQALDEAADFETQVGIDIDCESRHDPGR